MLLHMVRSTRESSLLFFKGYSNFFVHNNKRRTIYKNFLICPSAPSLTSYLNLKGLRVDKNARENNSLSRHDEINNWVKTLNVSFVSHQWLFGKWTEVMAGESRADITALASLWHNTDNWTIRMGPSRADAQLISTSLTAHRSGSFPGACSKWSETSDSRQTLPNPVRGASQRVCGNTAVGWWLLSFSKLEAKNTHTYSTWTYICRYINKSDEICIETQTHFRVVPKLMPVSEMPLIVILQYKTVH